MLLWSHRLCVCVDRVYSWTPSITPKFRITFTIACSCPTRRRARDGFRQWSHEICIITLQFGRLLSAGFWHFLGSFQLWAASAGSAGRRMFEGLGAEKWKGQQLHEGGHQHEESGDCRTLYHDLSTGRAPKRTLYHVLSIRWRLLPYVTFQRRITWRP